MSFDTFVAKSNARLESAKQSVDTFIDQQEFTRKLREYAEAQLLAAHKRAIVETLKALPAFDPSEIFDAAELLAEAQAEIESEEIERMIEAEEAEQAGILAGLDARIAELGLNPTEYATQEDKQAVIDAHSRKVVTGFADKTNELYAMVQKLDNLQNNGGQQGEMNRMHSKIGTFIDNFKKEFDASEHSSFGASFPFYGLPSFREWAAN